MISEELQKMIKQYKEQGKMRFLEPASEEQISQFENNNAKLPLKYKEWLKCSDGGELFLPAGIQLYGVAHKPLIEIEDEDRPDDSYIVIGAFASGDPILCEKSGENISIYNHESERVEDDEIYEDFTAFLKDLHDLLGIGE